MTKNEFEQFKILAGKLLDELSSPGYSHEIVINELDQVGNCVDIFDIGGLEVILNNEWNDGTND